MLLSNLFAKLTGAFTTKPNKLSILVLGFYNRDNTGDELYKEMFPILFKNQKLTFACIDDVSQVPKDTDIVICGGGEIINDYFMTKVSKIIQNFTGQVYAISVGLSYKSDAKYLEMFDHVFIRNMEDYKTAQAAIGDKNCTFLPDITNLLKPVKKGSKGDTIKNIGVSLAQPVFFTQPHLLLQVTKVITKILEDNENIHMHLFSFNSHLSNPQECDIFLNENIITNLSPTIKQRCSIVYNTAPCDVFRKIGEMDFNICMRYHSVVFSLINNVPFIALYRSSKVDTLLDDEGVQAYNYKFTDNIDIDSLYTQIKYQLKFQNNVKRLQSACNFDVIPETVLNRKQKRILIKRRIRPFPEVLQDTSDTLKSYLNCNDITHETLKKEPSIDIARLMCYIITGNCNHPCVWGLSENISKPEFNFIEAVLYIYENQQKSFKPTIQYHPKLQSLRTCLVNVDIAHNNIFDGVHRSGWQYVISGLMNVDARNLGRQGNILVDTYVDRTFHWGEKVGLAMKLIPYKTPWIGFIHHTFDETHGEHNCTTLFKNANFIESLKCCKALITLSTYLSTQVKAVLAKNNIKLPVYVLCHPTEFVSNSFTFEKFMANPNKKVIQIGAWLRNPYGIYQLPLHKQFGNPLSIRKATLKGREMDAYFKPKNFFEILESLLQQHCNCKPFICRPNTECENKYIRGLIDTILFNDKSVELIEHVNNTDYDELLSKNIVFLNLVDCSAVNTVIECITRNTPLLVNRHPALEEILGRDYPGFYSSYLEAVCFLGSEKRLKSIYKHMTEMNKDMLQLETFMTNFMNIVNKCT